ncbi:MAG: helix-turn-helix domain-containing protein [Bacteroidota bacterium]
MIWFQAEFLSIRYPVNIGVSIFYGTRYGSWLVPGPLFLFYIWSATGRRVKWRQIFIHLAPFVLLSILAPLAMDGILNFRQIHYGMLAPFDAYNQEVTALQYFYSAVFMGQYIHFLAYLVFISVYLKNYEKQLRTTYSNYEGETYRWFGLATLSMYLVLGFATVFLTLLFFTQIYRRHLDYIYVPPMSVLVYLVIYKLAGVQWSRPVMEEQKKYHKSSLRVKEAVLLATRVVDFFDSDKPYLNNGLRLQDISSQLEIPTHHLSQLFNQQLQTTFFDFVNEKRVAAAQKFIEDKPSATLLEIAFDSGFNNKTSFVNAFKKHAGMTPSAYRKQLIFA